MSDTLLTPEEVAELTEIRTGRHGKTREQLQIAWLRTSGLQFWVSAHGRPRVPRAAIEGRTAAAIDERDDAPWIPNVLAKAS